MMNKKIISQFIYTTLLLALVGLCTSSCTLNDKWDGYYSDQRQLSAKNIWEYLQSNNDYAKFSALMKKCGLDKELSGTTNLTLIAVKDEHLEATFLEMNLDVLSDEEVDILRNQMLIHLIYGEAFQYMLDHDQRLSTYRGKYVEFKKSSFSTINTKEVELSNIYTGNGVVHHSKGIIPTYNNIYEKIYNLGPEYSMIQEYIKSFDEKIFDKENSTPKFLNDDGNMVYDTIWIEKNTFLSKCDPRDEEHPMTAILPSNKIVLDALDQVKEKVVITGGTITESLLENMKNWCLRSIFYKGTPLSEPQDIYDLNSSAQTRFLIESGKQEIDRKGLIQTSNGLVFLATKLYIPKSMYMKTLHFIPSDLWRFDKEMINKYLSIPKGVVMKIKPFNPKWGYGFKGNFITKSPRNEKYSISFPKTFNVIKDSEGEDILKEVALIPGNYEIRVLSANGINGRVGGSVKLFFNGIQAGNVWRQNLPKYYNAKKKPVSFCNFDIPEEWGTNTIEIRVDHIKKSNKDVYKQNSISILQISFIPSKSNY
ncbi:fasciclin domain-containing protein [Halosquirtibacter xylanolyticus]|uniref:fasciclin domain-containing protein n=1 Tax=Halosquirtibacter xylanolyticus TaxID=3374599 RepID=UPI003748B1EA|nr:fasciclin domain-containing protein [Prolixibacteraceae bacterium]